jgi:hypothetical protein
MKKIGSDISSFIVNQIEKLEQEISYCNLHDKITEESDVPNKQLRYKTQELIQSVAEYVKAIKLKFWHCYLTARSDNEAD